MGCGRPLFQLHLRGPLGHPTIRVKPFLLSHYWCVCFNLFLLWLWMLPERRCWWLTVQCTSRQLSLQCGVTDPPLWFSRHLSVSVGLTETVQHLCVHRGIFRPDLLEGHWSCIDDKFDVYWLMSLGILLIRTHYSWGPYGDFLLDILWTWNIPL